MTEPRHYPAAPDSPPKSIAQWVNRLRSRTLEGKLVDVVPYGPVFAEDLRNLRNRPLSRHFLTQTMEITAPMQVEWYKGYLGRENDVCWVVTDKSGRFLGSESIYDMDAEKGCAEIGRQVFDTEVSRGAPYVLEARLLMLDLYFAAPFFNRIINHIREDNDKVISFNLRLGFAPDGIGEIRGISIPRFSLTRDSFNPAPFRGIIDNWYKRTHK
jgi:RimJ/RimL family protein N-acetyltransferase